MTTFKCVRLTLEKQKKKKKALFSTLILYSFQFFLCAFLSILLLVLVLCALMFLNVC